MTKTDKTPKPAHRNNAQKIVGYLSAGQVSLGIAARMAEKDPRYAKRITRLIEEIEKLK